MTSHPEIAWDDYEKDYSDLPADILQAHQFQQEAQDVAKRLEKTEKDERDILQVNQFRFRYNSQTPVPKYIL